MNAWFAERVHSIQPSTSKESPPPPPPPQQQSYQATTDLTLSSTPSNLLPPLVLLDSYNQSPSSAPSPAPGTPTRKISASEFDRPLRPIIVKDAEGSLTFLSDADRETVPIRGSIMGEGGGGDGGWGIGAGGGSGSDRCARLLELVKEVSSHLDVTALCHKIFLHINELIAADRYSLFLVGRVGTGTISAWMVFCFIKFFFFSVHE